MGFDVENFGIGLLAGWGSAYAVYRARRHIGAVVRWTRRGASDAQRYATQGAESRYVNNFIRRAERLHLAGEFVNLSDVLVEPRFVPAQRPPGGSDDEETRDVFDMVPRVPDFPALHAPYNIDTLSIGDLAAGDRALALLGEQGSGRSIALLTIALHSLGHVQFKPPIDRVQQKIDSEDARLNEKDRATRIRERVVMQQRARERLAEDRGETPSGDTSEETTSVPLFFRLMPVYVHMADVPLKGDYGDAADPAEPLVRAVQARAGRVTAGTFPRNLYSRLNKGGVLLLIDGYDDLPETERPAYVDWLRALMAQYSSNVFIVAGPAVGYGPLADSGLTPVFLRPWSDLDTARAAERWADVWPKLSGKRKNARPPEQALVDRAKQGNRALLPLEVVLKIWSAYANDTDSTGPGAWQRAYLARHLGGDTFSETLLEQMAQIAAIQLDEGDITRERLTALAISDDSETSAETGQGKKEDTEQTTAEGKLLGLLRRHGLLVRYSGDRYRFRHALVAAWLAGQTLRDAPTKTLAERALQPAWSAAIGYAAIDTPIDAAVSACLSAPADVLSFQSLQPARWLAYAGPNVNWRTQVLKHLGNLLTGASQYPILRERAAAALVTSRDSTVPIVFRRAVRNTNADVRRLACFGLGAVGEPEGVRDLVPLMQDHDPLIQLTACMSLSAIRHPDATEALLVGFTEGAESIRQAAAIAFAGMPEDGYPILHDAISDADMAIRRAAVFGLRRIPATWALIDIYRAFLEDEQWYVRSAAQQAFQESQFGRERLFAATRPRAEELPWLQAWSTAQGEAVPPGEASIPVLLRALQDNDSGVRALAAAALGAIGVVTTIKPLYAALRDRQEEVRGAAYHALAALQLQLGAPLPAPAT
jgi:HEAT repeat protein